MELYRRYRTQINQRVKSKTGKKRAYETATIDMHKYFLIGVTLYLEFNTGSDLESKESDRFSRMIHNRASITRNPFTFLRNGPVDRRYPVPCWDH